jgi:hypothetical protein
MSEIRVEISGHGIPDGHRDELALRLVESYTAVIGDGLHSEIAILIGHRPMVFSTDLSDEECSMLAAAVMGTFFQVLGRSPEATHRVQVRFSTVPQTEREHLLKQHLDLRAALADHQAAQDQLGELPARQQEIERLEAEIRALETQLEHFDDL